MEIKKENTCISLAPKKEDLNQLITFCYSTAISYANSKFDNSANLPDTQQQLEKLSIHVCTSIFYLDEFKSISFAPEHEKNTMN